MGLQGSKTAPYLLMNVPRRNDRCNLCVRCQSTCSRSLYLRCKHQNKVKSDSRAEFNSNMALNETSQRSWWKAVIIENQYSKYYWSSQTSLQRFNSARRAYLLTSVMATQVQVLRWTKRPRRALPFTIQ